MAMKNINVSVLVQNTHGAAANYYGPARATMVAGPPLPANIAFIGGCIAEAQNGFRDTSDPTLGTIIVLPEFILQPREGAYTSAQRAIAETHLTNILGTLPNTVLVVFGTIVSESAGGGQFYNDLLYGIGGGALQHTGKLNLSNIDLIHDATLATTIGWDAAGILKQNTAIAPLHWNLSSGANHTINFKGKTIGLSVCLDYAANVLATRLAAANSIDLHIVSSCGMQYVDGQTGVYDDTGKVIVCDAFGEWSSVNQVNKYGQSKQKSSMLTTESTIGGVATKIRRTQIMVPA